MGGGLRYFGGGVAFGFAAVWIMWSLSAALICLLASVVGYGSVVVAERARAKLAARAGGSRVSTAKPSRVPGAEDLSSRADDLNHDLGHVYKPAAAMPALPVQADGSPITDGAAAPGEIPH
jgi:hypothetical protein